VFGWKVGLDFEDMLSCDVEVRLRFRDEVWLSLISSSNHSRVRAASPNPIQRVSYNSRRHNKRTKISKPLSLETAIAPNTAVSFFSKVVWQLTTD